MGLLAGLLLATSFVLVGYGRVPLVYGPLAAGLAAAFWLQALAVRRGVAWAHAAPALAVAALAVGLKETAVAFVPALVAGAAAASRRPGRALALSAAAVAGAALLAWAARHDLVAQVAGMAGAYLGEDAGALEVAGRIAVSPLASGLLAGAPGLLSLGAALALVLGLEAARLAPALALPTRTLREANRAVARTLPTGAAVEGSFAHALTYDAAVGRRFFEDRAGAADSTHIAFEAAQAAHIEGVFARGGAPLEPVLEVRIRGYAVRLYRFPWAGAGARERSR